MRKEDLIDKTFHVVEGADIFVICALETGEAQLRSIKSIGYPMRVLEVHAMSPGFAVATVFSFKNGGRYMIVFNFDDLVSV